MPTFATPLRDASPEMVANPVMIDEDFHEIVARAAGNQAMIGRLGNVSDRLKFVRMGDITNAERLEAAGAEHLEILEAIDRRDPAKAIDALCRNIEGGGIKVENAITETLANAHAICR